MAISVGIVGYPNVGKSSVINSMKRSAATQTGAKAGVTRSVQEVVLDSKVKLLDSPGVVFSGASEDPSVVMRNATKVETLKDPVGVVSALLSRAPSQALMRHFSLPQFHNARDFVVLVAKQRGKLKKGGILDLESAARHILSEWATGKIRYYCMPPKKEEGASASIVTEYAKDFDVDALFKAEEPILQSLESIEDGMCMESAECPAFVKEDEEMDAEEESEEESESDDDAMEAEEENEMMIAEGAKKKTGSKDNSKPKMNANNPQKGKARKAAMKKESDDYDFKTDFAMDME